MKVWVYSRLEYTRRRFEFEIWFKEPTRQSEVYFLWPPEAKEYDAKELIKTLFERADKYADFDLHFVAHP